MLLKRLFLTLHLFLFLSLQAIAATGRADECIAFYKSIGEQITAAELPQGPRILLPALNGSREFKDFHELKFTAYNVLNLNQDVGKHEMDLSGKLIKTSNSEIKPEWPEKQ